MTFQYVSVDEAIKTKRRPHGGGRQGAEPVGRGSQGHSSRQEYRMGSGAAGLRQRAAQGVGRSAQRSDSDVRQRTATSRLGRNSAVRRAPRAESFLAT